MRVGFGGGALGLVALTTVGPSATFRSVFDRALLLSERNVADGPTVVRARPNQSALKQNTPTSEGLTPTLRPVFIRALLTSERNVADGPTVVRASAQTERSETDRAHVRGTDAYMALYQQITPRTLHPAPRTLHPAYQRS